MNEQESKRVAERMYETFNSGDVEGFLNLFSEDADWDSPKIENIPVETKFKGRENLARFISDLNEHEEVLQIEPREYIVQGERVVIIGDYRVRSRKTNREYGSDFVHIVTVRDGEVTDFLEFFDNAAAGRVHSDAQTA